MPGTMLAYVALGACIAPPQVDPDDTGTPPSTPGTASDTATPSTTDTADTATPGTPPPTECTPWAEAPQHGTPAAAIHLGLPWTNPASTAWTEEHPLNPPPAVDPGELGCVWVLEDPAASALSADEVVHLTVRWFLPYEQHYYYDAYGRLVLYDDGYERFCYLHDAWGGVVEQHFAWHPIEPYDGKVERYEVERDSWNRPVSLTATGEGPWPGMQDLEWTWDASNRPLEHVRYTSGWDYDGQPYEDRTTYTWSGDCLLERERRREMYFLGGSTDRWLYTWDGDGRLAVEEHIDDGVVASVFTYHYDDQGRLERSVMEDADGASPPSEVTWTWDDQGRLSEVIEDGWVVQTWTWD